MTHKTNGSLDVAVTSEGPPATSNESARTQLQLTLSEAAAVSGVRVHLLKAAISDGAARRCFWDYAATSKCCA